MLNPNMWLFLPMYLYNNISKTNKSLTTPKQTKRLEYHISSIIYVIANKHGELNQLAHTSLNIPINSYNTELQMVRTHTNEHNPGLTSISFFWQFHLMSKCSVVRFVWSLSDSVWDVVCIGYVCLWSMSGVYVEECG